MKNKTTYYVVGAVLVGVGIYLFASKKKDKNDTVTTFEPPMEVTETVTETVTDVTTTTGATVLSALDKLKALIDSIKSKKETTNS